MEPDPHAKDIYLQAAHASSTPWNSTKTVGRVSMHGSWSLVVCRVHALDGRESIEVQAWRRPPKAAASGGRYSMQ
jgi:hypothetical protein